MSVAVSASMVGKYSHTLDQKSRVSVPAALRKKLGELVYLTVSDGDYLFGYTEAGWEKFNAQLVENTNEDEASQIRANTHECTIDAQGRISIPHELRELAGLEVNVVIQGDGDKIRIWNAESFEKQNDRQSLRENIRSIRQRALSGKPRDDA